MCTCLRCVRGVVCVCGRCACFWCVCGGANRGGGVCVRVCVWCSGCACMRVVKCVCVWFVTCVRCVGGLVCVWVCVGGKIPHGFHHSWCLCVSVCMCFGIMCLRVCFVHKQTCVRVCVGAGAVRVCHRSANGL